MNETIKFTKDSERGYYATDDTGTLVGFCRDYTDRVIGIVRLESGAYVEAPLGDFEYSAEES